jgi:hypothetical protein
MFLMFPPRSFLTAVAVASGLLLTQAARVVADDKLKIEHPLGFNTAMSGEFLRRYWESVQDRHKMQGNVSDHLTKKQIESLVMLEVNIAVRETDHLADELLAFMTEGNRFQVGPLPESFDKKRPTKYLVALLRTKDGDYGLITRYRDLAVIELKGYVGVALVASGDKPKRAAPPKR